MYEHSYDKPRTSDRYGMAKLPSGWYGTALTKAIVSGLGGLALIVAAESIDVKPHARDLAQAAGAAAIAGGIVGAVISTGKRAARGEE